jgi:hypothetical protein
LRGNGVRSFRDIAVDESNILYWQGIIVPVSYLVTLSSFLVFVSLNRALLEVRLVSGRMILDRAVVFFRNIEAFQSV